MANNKYSLLDAIDKFLIVDYSEKSIAIPSDYDMIVTEEFTNIGGRYNSRLKFGAGWVFSKKKCLDRLTHMFDVYGAKYIYISIDDMETTDTGAKNVPGGHKKSETPNYILTDAERRGWAKNVMENEDYYYKEYNIIVRLADGSLVPIVKNSIKTEFWFGESDCGQGLTSEEANKRAHTASTDEAYFINENTKDYKDMISRLKGTYDGSYKYLWLANWYDDRRNCWKLDTSSICPQVTNAVECLDCRERQMYDEGAYRKLSDDDTARLLAGYRLALAAMEKRLSTYLKCYGMSKVSGRVFWADR